MQKNTILNVILVLSIIALLIFCALVFIKNKNTPKPIITTKETVDQDIQSQPQPEIPINLNDSIDNTVTIMSPKSEDKFKNGDVVTVEIRVGKDVSSIDAVYGSSLEGPSSVQQKHIITTGGGNYSFSYNIPSTLTGPLEFTIFSDDMLGHDTVTIEIVTTAIPAQFVIDESENFNPNNNDNQIALWKALNPEVRTSLGFSVRFSDGIIRKIPFKDIQITGGNKNIVEIESGNFSNALFYAKNVGSTDITFTYKNISKTMKILVSSMY